jgi:hypothetical protein
MGLSLFVRVRPGARGWKFSAEKELDCEINGADLLDFAQKES